MDPDDIYKRKPSVYISKGGLGIPFPPSGEMDDKVWEHIGYLKESALEVPPMSAREVIDVKKQILGLPSKVPSISPTEELRRYWNTRSVRGNDKVHAAPMLHGHPIHCSEQDLSGNLLKTTIIFPYVAWDADLGCYVTLAIPKQNHPRDIHNAPGIIKIQDDAHADTVWYLYPAVRATIDRSAQTENMSVYQDMWLLVPSSRDHQEKMKEKEMKAIMTAVIKKPPRLHTEKEPAKKKPVVRAVAVRSDNRPKCQVHRRTMEFVPEKARWVCTVDSCDRAATPAYDADRTVTSAPLVLSGAYQWVVVRNEATQEENLYLRHIETNTMLDVSELMEDDSLMENLKPGEVELSIRIKVHPDSIILMKV